MNALVNWLDSRTGIRSLIHEALYERIPGGSRWRYVWGSTLVFAFFTQVITGIVLWMYYSPSTQTAWESVYYIQHETAGGWLLRGVHHFMAQAMVVLLALHLMQVVIDGAYRAPREVNFWLGLILMQIVLGLSLTGYLLPWDQKGYWATRVATNLLSVVPGVGPSLQSLVVGGAEYGHHTLTRFFALHAGVLPGALIFFLVLHVALFRRHGICYRLPPKFADTSFWPDQVLKDAVACLAVLIVVLVMCLRPAEWFSSGGMPPLGPELGAELSAPADPANQYSAARPEWYFLFLFQFLKFFEGGGEYGELMGAVVVPSLVMLLLFLMPILGRWNLGHRFNIGMLMILLGGVLYLTVDAYYEDHQAAWASAEDYEEIKPLVEELGSDEEKIQAHFDGDAGKIEQYRRQREAYQRYRKSQEYLRSVEKAEQEAQRAIDLASAPAGIPTSGAITLLRNDPKTQGPKLFGTHCASCHSYEEVALDAESLPPAVEDATAPNLHGFASRAWLSGLLSEHFTGPLYFGNTAHAEGEMAGFVVDTLSEWKPADVEKVVMALSAEAQLPTQQQADADDAEQIEAGRALIANEENCAMCHKFGDAGDYNLGVAPDLTGYGSRAWLIGMISNPNHQRFYPDTNDRMPAFGERLSPHAIEMIADWLRGEWYEPSGAERADTDTFEADDEASPAEADAAEDSPAAGDADSEPADSEPADSEPADSEPTGADAEDSESEDSDASS